MNLILLFIAHLIGDYYFQSSLLANKKKESFKEQLKHTLIYTLTFIPVVILYENALKIILIVISLFITHLLVDFLRVEFDKHKKGMGKQLFSFIVDQIIHLMIIIVISTFMKNNNRVGEIVFDKFIELINYLNINSQPLTILLGLLFILFILQPTAVLIKHINNYIFRSSIDTNVCIKEDSATGAIIGKLERLVIFILGLMGLYGTIGIVLAAKSLARFKQLEDKEFAEKYIIGTLMSLLVALISLGLFSLLK